jgi:hypothetical protein
MSCGGGGGAGGFDSRALLCSMSLVLARCLQAALACVWTCSKISATRFICPCPELETRRVAPVRGTGATAQNLKTRCRNDFADFFIFYFDFFDFFLFFILIF